MNASPQLITRGCVYLWAVVNARGISLAISGLIAARFTKNVIATSWRVLAITLWQRSRLRPWIPDPLGSLYCSLSYFPDGVRWWQWCGDAYFARGHTPSAAANWPDAWHVHP